tara:strand:- start:2133 stop:2399 length:267 start_codon:yes stop_codon:yes gene_type:complete
MESGRGVDTRMTFSFTASVMSGASADATAPAQGKVAVALWLSTGGGYIHLHGDGEELLGLLEDAYVKLGTAMKESGREIGGYRAVVTG